MAKSDKVMVNQDFAAATEAELDLAMRAFKDSHEAATGQRLAIDTKRSLGAGRFRIGFRVVAVADDGKKARKSR